MSQPLNNRVTIFSNGIADFCRIFKTTGEPQKIELPVNKEHIGDILASLIVSGPVALTAPPSFTPENETRPILKLASENVFQDIGRRLRGAEVEIEKCSGEPLRGRLFGLDSEEVATGDEATYRYFYQVLTTEGLERVLQEQVKRIKFLQESVQSEVDKALQRAFQTIQPQSTTISLEVTGEQKDSDFFLHYTVPAAAWKMTYRMRVTDNDILFDGVGVVDNNTEEDWDGFFVGLVMGEPITFSTDVAKAKIPSRSNVNLVDEQAQGAVEVERGLAIPHPPMQSKIMASQARSDHFGSLSDEDDLWPSLKMLSPAPAMEADAGHREVGDFSIFEFNSPLSIKSGQSAAIPVFNTELRDAKLVLFYKSDNHPERPFRTIKFKNETDQNLGRGVCTVYEDGTYAGSSVLPAAKKGEDVMLCHALETGVRIRFTPGEMEEEIVAVSISGGVVIQTQDLTRCSEYIVSNIKDEKFAFVLDHEKLWDGNLTCTIGDKTVDPSESLKNGARFEFELPPGDQMTLTVNEQFTQEQRITIGGRNYGVNTLKNFFIAAEHPLAENRGIQEVVKLQATVDELDEQKEELDSRCEVVESEQQRVAGLLKKDPNNEEWKKDLRTSENEIREITRKAKPDIAKRYKAAVLARNEALNKLVCNWKK